MTSKRAHTAVLLLIATAIGLAAYLAPNGFLCVAFALLFLSHAADRRRWTKPHHK